MGAEVPRYVWPLFRAVWGLVCPTAVSCRTGTGVPRRCFRQGLGRYASAGTGVARHVPAGCTQYPPNINCGGHRTLRDMCRWVHPIFIQYQLRGQPGPVFPKTVP